MSPKKKDARGRETKTREDGPYRLDLPVGHQLNPHILIDVGQGKGATHSTFGLPDGVEEIDIYVGDYIQSLAHTKQALPHRYNTRAAYKRSHRHGKNEGDLEERPGGALPEDEKDLTAVHYQTNCWAANQYPYYNPPAE
jgi:hypothetical protein